MEKQKVTLELINIQHAKSVVLCVLLLLAAAPVGWFGPKLFDLNLSMLLVLMAIIGWIWSAAEVRLRHAKFLAGAYDPEDKS